jgi:hypothetical protein
MPHIQIKGAKRTATAALILLLACLGLAACGSSSPSSSSVTTNAASTGAGGAQGRGAGRFAAMRACLQKNGVTLPQRAPGARRPPGGFGLLGGGTGQLPKGVTPAQLTAALKKCGLGNGLTRGGPGSARARLSSPAFKQALTAFVACMRTNGVNLPTPNTSGNGPVFNSKGLNTTGASFRAAQSKCRSALSGAFRGPPGSGGRPPAGSPGGAGRPTEGGSPAEGSPEG